MSAPVATTKSGAVRGTFEQGVVTFRGIPYAAPPVGYRRFVAPIPPQPWDGVREAGAFSPTPPQVDLSAQRFPGLDLSPISGESWRKGDDYLTLNIWTPDPGAHGLPVMVFIYGGAFVAGGSSTALYNGKSFARDGVILVSFNYRLGVEGFLSLAGGETNVGLRDQIAVLTWVQENISSFGGDPAGELARHLHHTWITFATTGDPGWAAYSTERRSVMHVADAWEVLTDPIPDERQAWDGAR